jgi:general secretion pathway protein M
MTTSFGPPSRVLPRLGALSILAVGLAAVWIAVLVPVWAMLMEPYERVDQLSASIQAYRAAAASRLELESELTALRAAAPSAHGLIQADTPALAAAQVQSDIRAIVDQVAGRIHSVQIPAPVSDGDYERIALRYDFSVPMDRLSDLLRRIESHVPFYFMDQVRIQAPDRAGIGASDDTAADVQIRGTIYAYRWVDGTWTQLSH